MTKRDLGQFFTARRTWLTEPVRRFLAEANCRTAFDPFAGGGDLLKAAESLSFRTEGADIDSRLGWPIADSLKSIPATDALILTNPPCRRISWLSAIPQGPPRPFP